MMARLGAHNGELSAPTWISGKLPSTTGRDGNRYVIDVSGPRSCRDVLTAFHWAGSRVAKAADAGCRLRRGSRFYCAITARRKKHYVRLNHVPYFLSSHHANGGQAMANEAEI